MAWIRANPNNKCPVCGKTSWCTWKRGKEPGTLFVQCMWQASGSFRSVTLNGSSTEAYHHIISDNGHPIRDLDIVVTATKPITSIENRDIAYRELCTGKLSSWHIDYLRSRGYAESLITRLAKKCRLTSIPYDAENRYKLVQKLSKKVSLSGVPGFWSTKNEEWHISIGGGLLFPVKNGDNKVVGCQTTSDKWIFNYWKYTKNGLVSPDNSESKYKWLSSAPYVDMYSDKPILRRANGAGAEALPHFIGFSPKMQTDKDLPCIIITEGVLKANVIYLLSGFPTIGQPGVGIGTDAIVTTLKDYKTVITIAYDLDYKTNPNVSRALQILNEKLKEDHGHRAVISDKWPLEFKGYDDFLLSLQKGNDCRSELSELKIH